MQTVVSETTLSTSCMCILKSGRGRCSLGAVRILKLKRRKTQGIKAFFEEQQEDPVSEADDSTEGESKALVCGQEVGAVNRRCLLFALRLVRRFHLFLSFLPATVCSHQL